MLFHQIIRTIVTLGILGIYSAIYAQQPGQIDTTFFTVGTFNSDVSASGVQSDGKVIASGGYMYGFKDGNLVRLTTGGLLDHSFKAEGADNTISIIEICADDKIVLSGSFTKVNGVNRKTIAVLNSDGSLDLNFNPGTGFNGAVKTILPVGNKLMVAGSFTSYNGVTCPGLIRLNADGTRDISFSPSITITNNVTCLDTLANGSLVAGGWFAGNVPLVVFQNNGTVDASFSSTSNAGVTALKVVNDNILLGGSFTYISGGSALNFVLLNTDGTRNTSFAATSASSGFIASQFVVDADNRITVRGQVGTAQPTLIRLTMTGAKDNTFTFTCYNSVLNFTNFSGIDNIELAPGSNVIISGKFSSVNDVYKNGIARLHATGELDVSFGQENGADDAVYATAIQSDDKIIVAGNFTVYNNKKVNRIVRINDDGSIDQSFDPGTGANDAIKTIHIQPDGKILIGGSFTTYNGVSRPRLARLNEDGSLDNTFLSGLATNPGIWVNDIAMQSDHKIIIAGILGTYGGVACPPVIRINTDGTRDGSFTYISTVSYEVYSIAITPEDKILSTAGGFQIRRYEADGNVDATFTTSGGNDVTRNIFLQPDGKILVTGAFITYNGVARARVARLNADGSLDTSFDPGNVITDVGKVVVMDADGNVVVSSYGVKRLLRLKPNGALDTHFKRADIYGLIETISLDAYGGIIVAGNITKYDHVNVGRIFKLYGKPGLFNTIRGYTYTDNNQDCEVTLADTKRPYQLIMATPGDYYTMSNDIGHYKLRVDTGTASYVVKKAIHPQLSVLYHTQCDPQYTVNLTYAGKDTCCFNFADTIRQCTLPYIDVASMQRRRCMRGITTVTYSNMGNTSMNTTVVKVFYPAHIIPISSNPMWSYKQDSVLVYDLGVLPKTTSGRIVITDSVDCGNPDIRGLTQCVKAYISPHSNCTNDPASWDHSDITVNGTCVNSKVQVVIKNEGTGDMSEPRSYRVFRNDTLIFIGIFQLTAGDEQTLDINNNSAAIRVEADQDDDHPHLSKPSVIIENCGSNVVLSGYGLTSSQDDESFDVVSTCARIVDSYDPNDKTALPVGKGPDHNIKATDKLEYVIRFQNTGTAEAINIRIVDTLDANLDVSTLYIGTSSHSYRAEVDGKGRAVLIFYFNDIYLPDSTTNLLGSQGYIKYSIYPKADLTPGATIHNNAGIYFDFNEPVITNTTYHTIAEDEIVDLTKGTIVTGTVPSITSKALSEKVKVYPNPAREEAYVFIDYQYGSASIEVYDLVGMKVYEQELSSAGSGIRLDGWNKGFYVYRILIDNVPVTGKIVVE